MVLFKHWCRCFTKSIHKEIWKLYFMKASVEKSSEHVRVRSLDGRFVFSESHY
jgi:hypothetical protein